MEFQVFDAIKPISTALSDRAERGVVDSETGIFSDIFGAAIDAVKETDAEKNHAEYLLATGQLDNPAELTIATTKAQMSVELLVQLRNKALEAYSEVMRIGL